MHLILFFQSSWCKILVRQGIEAIQPRGSSEPAARENLWHDTKPKNIKEYKAKSPRLHSADIYPREQEAVRKTTPELLSAVLRSLLCGVCVYFTTSILCTLYSRVGRFCTFWILCKVMLFAAPLGELPFFLFGSKTSEFYTFKGPYFPQKNPRGKT